MLIRYLAYLLVGLLLAALALPMALAAEVGAVRGTGSGGGEWSFTLHDAPGELCNGEWRRTVYRQTKPVMEVEGCWLDDGGMVHLVYTDGDRYRIPRASFQGV